MGRYISKSSAIESVSFKLLRKGHVYKGCQVIRVNDTDLLVKTSNGEFTISGRQGSALRKYAILSSKSNPTQSVLNGLKKIGVISEEDIEAHNAAVKERVEAQEKRWAVQSIVRSCDTLGIKVPASVAKMKSSQPND